MTRVWPESLWDGLTMGNVAFHGSVSPSPDVQRAEQRPVSFQAWEGRARISVLAPLWGRSPGAGEGTAEWPLVGVNHPRARWRVGGQQWEWARWH